MPPSKPTKNLTTGIENHQRTETQVYSKTINQPGDQELDECCSHPISQFSHPRESININTVTINLKTKDENPNLKPIREGAKDGTAEQRALRVDFLSHCTNDADPRKPTYHRKFREISQLNLRNKS